MAQRSRRVATSRLPRRGLRVSALEEPATIEHGTGGVGSLQRVPQTLRRSTLYLDFPDEKAREIDLGANPFGDRQGHLIAVVRCR